MRLVAAHGVPTPVIQLLGRWTSRAVERYTQSAPLSLAPGAAIAALAQAGGGPGGGSRFPALPAASR